MCPHVQMDSKRLLSGRISGTRFVFTELRRPQIKFIAAYQVAPVCAITHIAPVKSIEAWKGTGKYVVIFSEPAQEIAHVQLVKKGRVKALQNLRYTRRDRLLSAKTLDDVW